MMTMRTIKLVFVTGLKRPIFSNVRLSGSWDANGHYSDNWSESPMQQQIGEDGCPVFIASISLDSADRDKIFKWSVILDGPPGANLWGIPTEVQDINSVDRYREFRIIDGIDNQTEYYYFTYG